MPNGFEQNVFTPMNTDMRCCIVADPAGNIVIVHDKDIKSALQWIEYDPKDNKLFLIHEEGQIQDLGIYPNDAMKKNIAHGSEIKLVKFSNNLFESEQSVVLLIKDY